jgi:ribose/xylose/arabinose/galactoside ABC-type transport system permease subunit|tara:strand:- start:194 stop:373 length:180 start_codon:yes stop_codon:yes gene_type:complete
MNNLTKYLIIFGILILILGQGGILGAVFGFIISIFRVPAFIGLLIIILALIIHYNKGKK